MSADQVDDVEHAEDRLHSVTEALRDLARTCGEPPPMSGDAAQYRQARRAALERLREQVDYCRPTCGMEGEVHVLADGTVDVDNDCGCPCHDQ